MDFPNRQLARRLLVLSASAGALSGSLFSATPALAIAVPIPPVVSASLNIIENFPAGGTLSGSATCTLVGPTGPGTGGCSISAPGFTDSEGEAIAGKFMNSAHRYVSSPSEETVGFVFIPEIPLEPGTYTATVMVRGTVEDDIDEASVTFNVVEATEELPSLVTELLVGSSVGGEELSCIELSPTGLEYRFHEGIDSYPVIVATLSGLNASQYSYAIGFDGEEAEELSFDGFSRVIEGEPEEVCFYVVARSYLDESDVTLGSECLTTEGLDLGFTPRPDTEMDNGLTLIEALLSGCVVPPSGYEDEWCSYFEETFTAESCWPYDLDACLAARSECPDGDHPSADAIEEERLLAGPQVGSGGAPGAGGSASIDDGVGSTAGTAGASVGGDESVGEDDGAGDPNGINPDEGGPRGTGASAGGPDGSGTGDDDEAGGDVDENAADFDEGVGEEGGCSVRAATPQKPSSFWWLAGFAFLFRRRRGFL